MTPRTIQRFYSHIKWPNGDGCWEFDQTHSPGYGYFQIRGKQFAAHRIAWEIFYEKKPTKWILHRCDNPACIRPGHLFEGNQSDNMRDMIKKKRHNRSGLIVPDSVLPIIHRLRGRVPQQRLANILGVSKGHINNIQCGLRRGD